MNVSVDDGYLRMVISTNIISNISVTDMIPYS